MNQTCQSCGMPLAGDELRGTEADGLLNSDYCIYCYKDGKFVDDMNLSEYIEASKKHAADYAEQAGVTETQMIEHIETVLPTLKRWKK